MDPNLPAVPYNYDNFKSRRVDPNNDFTWLLDVLCEHLKSPSWTTEICNFIDDNCIAFAGNVDDENSFEFTSLHNRFKKIVDLKLEEFVMEYGVTHQMFMTACNQVQTKKQMRSIDQLMACNNFELFKKMMIARNTRLN